MSRGWIGTLIVLSVAVSLAACDKVPLLAPSASTIVLSAGTTIIPSGGSTQLTAFVSEPGGTPVQNGTTVRFTTTLGTLTAIEAQTNNGMATTTLLAGSSSGLAEVRASSGGATGGTGTAATNVVTITIGTAAVTAVAVRANPASVSASGSTVEIVAIATGVNNRPVVAVPVTFSTTAGTLSSTTATTDANGEARVQLTTNRAATVSAAVGGQAGTANVTVTTAATVALGTPAPAAPTVGQQVTVVVTPATGTAPRVVMNWGDGSQSDLGLVSAPVTATHAYNNPGPYVITATATDAGETFTTTTSVTVGPRPGPTITANPQTGPASTTNFVFTVTPASNTGIRDVVVDFGDGQTVDLGPITSVTSVSHRYSAPTTAQPYTVRATQTDTSGNTTSAVVVITVTPP